MPRYTFKCPKCPWEHTKVLTIAEYTYFARQEHECPKCYTRVMRKWEPINFRFKGGLPSANRE